MAKNIAGHSEKNPAKESEKSPSPPISLVKSDSARWPLLLSVIPTFIALWRALRGFSAKPEELLLDAAKGASIGDLGAKVSFQMRFKEQFNDVTTAFGDKQLVIFIDDLDRCAPGKILEMMEAMNFLVSSGKCFVVLSFSREQIEAGLSLAFAKIAKEIELDASDRSLAGDERNEEKQRRLAYSRSYLKKLINLEIHLPQVTPERIAQKIAPESNAALFEKPATWPVWVKLAVIFAGGFLILGLGSYVGANAPRWFPATPAPSLSTTTPKPEANTNSTGLKTSGVAPSVSTRDSANATTNVVSALGDAKNTPLVVEPVKNTWRIAWWCGLGVLAICGSALYLVLRRAASFQFKDSDSFLNALREWREEIVAAYPTGRESVRYVNLVRYMALRSRGAEPILTGRDIFRIRWRRLLGKSDSEQLATASSPVSGLTEAAVVAFSAIDAAETVRRPNGTTDPVEGIRLRTKLRTELDLLGKSTPAEQLEADLRKKYRELADEVSLY